MGIKAYREGQLQGGAWRLWLVARSLSDNGWVQEAALREKAVPLASERSYKRWLDGAIELKLLIYKSKSNRSNLFIANPIVAGRHLKVKEMGVAVSMPVKDLFGKGWRSKVFNGIHASYRRMMSRRTIKKLTGIPQRTQTRLDKQADTTRRKNWRKHKSTARHKNLDSQARHYQEQGIPMIPSRRKGESPFLRERLADSRESRYTARKRYSVRVSQLFNSKSQSIGTRLFYEATESFIYKKLEKLKQENLILNRFLEGEANGNLWQGYGASLPVMVSA